MNVDSNAQYLVFIDSGSCSSALTVAGSTSTSVSFDGENYSTGGGSAASYLIEYDGSVHTGLEMIVLKRSSAMGDFICHLTISMSIVASYSGIHDTNIYEIHVPVLITTEEFSGTYIMGLIGDEPEPLPALSGEIFLYGSGKCREKPVFSCHT